MPQGEDESLEREERPARHADEQLHICCQAGWLQISSQPCSGSCSRRVTQKWSVYLHHPQPEKSKGAVKVPAIEPVLVTLVEIGAELDVLRVEPNPSWLTFL